MIEAMKQALEALEIVWTEEEEISAKAHQVVFKAITSLRQAIAEAEKQEPVARIVDRFQGANTGSTMPEPIPIWFKPVKIGDVLYAHPQPKEKTND
jgi:hypothetical protein